jgi:CheY-like chemotaxis protein
MEEPLRILVVEYRHADRCIAEQLLTDYDLDFSWQCVASPLELRQVAADFDPNIVLCTDDMSMTSRHARLDSLRLLCSQMPVILVSSVCEVDASAVRNATTLFRKTLRQSLKEVSNHSVPDTKPRQCAARLCAEKMRRAIENTVIDTSAGAVRITVSIGVSGLGGIASRNSATVQSMLEWANTNLYASKASGRNRVTSSNSNDAPMTPRRLANHRPSHVNTKDSISSVR